jgi:4-nitrophenyl phosphatase
VWEAGKNLENKLKLKSLFIFDVEGVLMDSVDRPRPVAGALKLLDRLEAMGKKLHILSNVSRKSRRWIVEILRQQGFKVASDNITTASSATASYLRAWKPQARCFLIGEEGLVEELSAAGLELVEEGPADAVVVAVDRKVTYQRLNHAMKLVKSGARLVCAGPNPVFRGVFEGEEGYFLGGKALCEAIAVASGTPPKYVGKPYPEVFEQVLERYGTKPDGAAMVGDKLETDVLGAKISKIFSIYLTRESLGPKLSWGILPDLVVKNPEELLTLLE